MKNIGKITVKSSNEKLMEGFKWAKEQALLYVHSDDPVGLWYEAALPERDAFCMRDVAHQSMGAQLLGLKNHTKNMMKKFAANISESKDFCTYWEINKENLPAPVDYKNDDEFWYNLPANFDIVNCCLRQYKWTGDDEYINDPWLNDFYRITNDEYVKRWDPDNDGIMEHVGNSPIRGIASYLEGQVGKVGIKVGSDLLAAQYAGYLAYSEILGVQNRSEEEKLYKDKAGVIKNEFNMNWWSESNNTYNSVVLKNNEKIIVSADDAKLDSNMVTPMPLYFSITEEGKRSDAAVKVLLSSVNLNVETKSHLPEVLFNYGFNDDAFRELLELMDPSLFRREYPEVSYSVVSSTINGLMGINPDAVKGIIETKPRLESNVDWIEASFIPIFNNEISVKYESDNKITFKNQSGDPVIWKPTIVGKSYKFILNGENIRPKYETGLDGKTYSYIKVIVESNSASIIEYI